MSLQGQAGDTDSRPVWGKKDRREREEKKKITGGKERKKEEEKEEEEGEEEKAEDREGRREGRKKKVPRPGWESRTSSLFWWWSVEIKRKVSASRGSWPNWTASTVQRRLVLIISRENERIGINSLPVLP